MYSTLCSASTAKVVGMEPTPPVSRKMDYQNCVKCGTTDQGDDKCPGLVCCYHYKAHEAFLKLCNRYKFEKEVLVIRN